MGNEAGARWIAAILEARDWKPTDLAMAAGVAVSTVTRGSRADHPFVFSRRIVDKLTEASGIPAPQELLDALGRATTRHARQPRGSRSSGPATPREHADTIPMRAFGPVPARLSLVKRGEISVDRPAALAGMTGAFAFYPHDDALAPAASTRDLLYAAPAGGAFKGDMVLLVTPAGGGTWATCRTSTARPTGSCRPAGRARCRLGRLRRSRPSSSSTGSDALPGSTGTRPRLPEARRVLVDGCRFGTDPAPASQSRVGGPPARSARDQSRPATVSVVPLPSRQSLGLVGFGAFGRLTALHLSRHFDVLAHDPAHPEGRDPATGAALVTLAEAARCPVVVLAVPVAALPEACAAVRPHLRKGALVLDVGSVKVVAAEAMLAGLPAHVDIVATHPLFGPQSARDGLRGLKVAVCPVRGDRAPRVAAYLRGPSGWTSS